MTILRGISLMADSVKDCTLESKIHFQSKLLKIFKIYTNDNYFTFHVNIYLLLQANIYINM